MNWMFQESFISVEIFRSKALQWINHPAHDDSHFDAHLDIDMYTRPLEFKIILVYDFIC